MNQIKMTMLKSKQPHAHKANSQHEALQHFKQHVHASPWSTDTLA
jgi:hypothetical protein